MPHNISDLREHSIVVVAGGGPALPLLAGARVRVDGAPPGDGSGRRVRRLWLRRRRHLVVRGMRGADRGEVTVVVVGHGHVMHVAAKAVVVAVGEGERVNDLTS